MNKKNTRQQIFSTPLKLLKSLEILTLKLREIFICNIRSISHPFENAIQKCENHPITSIF